MNRRLAIISSFIFVAGCSGIGVIESDDPAVKLNQADHLYRDQNRYALADRLFHEAMEIYSSKNNELGLAEAHRRYAYFLQSSTLGGPTTPSRNLGLLDETVTSKNRYEKAKEYFLKSRPPFEKYSDYSSLGNIDWALGLLSIKDPMAACTYFEKSLEDARKFKEKTPNVSLYTVPGFNTFEEYLLDLKRKTGCK